MFKVYSRDNCKYCTIIKQFLTDNDIEFVEFDISRPSEHRTFILDQGFDTVPQVFDENDNYIGDCDTTIRKLQDI